MTTACSDIIVHALLFSVRMSSLFDGVPYSLQARNCDMWLFEDNGPVHIHELCESTLDEHAYRQPNPKGPSAYISGVLESSLSPCALLMIRLAALAGKSQDRLTFVGE